MDDIAICIIPALIGLLGALAGLWFGRELQRAQARKLLAEAEASEADGEKSEAERDKIVTEAMLLLINPLTKANTELQEEVHTMRDNYNKQLTSLRHEVDYYRQGVLVLVAQLFNAGIKPEFVPDTKKVF